MSLPDGWYLAIKGKGEDIKIVHVDKGNYAVMGRGASESEFKDYRFVEFDLRTMIEYADLLNELW